MELSKQNAQAMDKLALRLTRTALSHPLMMYYCPNKEKRSRYIRAYFRYHLPKWAKADSAIVSEDGHVVATLVDRNSFAYSFSGKYALQLFLAGDIRRLRLHRRVTHNIVNVMVPLTMPVRVMTLFGDSRTEQDALLEVVRAAQARARQEGFVLVYETFSRRLLSEMEALGFSAGYQRNFVNTQFVQTLMTYNIKQ